MFCLNLQKLSWFCNTNIYLVIDRYPHLKMTLVVTKSSKPG